MMAPLMDTSQVIVSMKGTQGGWTEWVMVRGRAEMEHGHNVFWVLPTDVIKNRFVKNRWDRSESYTPRYQTYKGRDEIRYSAGFNKAASMSLKHYAGAAVAFVGSNSPSVFGEFPADTLVIDEYDYCDKDNIPMAEERLSDSEVRRQILIGNPTIDGEGISRLYYDMSDQGRWYMKGACGHWIKPDWYTHVVRQVNENDYEVVDPKWESVQGADARLICDRCGKPISRHAEGEWVMEKPGALYRGYHVSKLFSTRMAINEMITRFEVGQSNPRVMERFENADLGEPTTVQGAKLSVNAITACVRDYPQGFTNLPCVAGVDVGAQLHVAIGALLPNGTVRTQWLGTVKGLSDLSDLWALVIKFPIRMGIIDEKPETRLARKIAYRSRRWWMCRYETGRRDMPDPRSRLVTVDRTVTLDAEVERINLQTIWFPRDTMGLKDFKEQMTTLTRKYDPEANKGEGGYAWVGSQPDHYFHAVGYMCLAAKIAARHPL